MRALVEEDQPAALRAETLQRAPAASPRAPTRLVAAKRSMLSPYSVSNSLRRCSAVAASLRAATTSRLTVTEEIRNAASANQFAGSAMVSV